MHRQVDVMRRLLAAGVVVALSGCSGAHHATNSGEGGEAAASAGGASGGRVGAAGNAAGNVSSGSGGVGGIVATSGGVPAQGGAESAGNGASVGTTGGSSVGGNAIGGRGGAPSGMVGGAPAGGARPLGGSSAGGDAPGGMGGEAPQGGAGGGTGTPDICSFDISGSLSPDIGTVGLVDWSTDLQGITSARIEFTLDDPAPDELNVGSGGPISLTDSRALLLGLKPGRSYTYRIVATAGATECVSAEHRLATQVDPKAPAITKTTGAHAAARSNGFFVTCIYSGSGGVLILDTDGAVVWRVTENIACTQAHMDWSGQYMWMMNANATYGTTGDVRRVRMDGSGAESITGLEKSHHDFAVLPDGTTAFLTWDQQTNSTSALVERSPDGTLHTLTVLDKSTLNANASPFHANSLRYYARDDTYSLTDLGTFGVYKVNRQGQITWSSSGYYGMHGHQLLANGNLLYFEAHNGSPNGSTSDPSPVYEYSFSQPGSTQTATQVWTYSGTAPSVILGDVWRRPNGNTLVTYSTNGSIDEVTPAGEVLQSLDLAAELGYSDFRETLYGPPLQTP